MPPIRAIPSNVAPSDRTGGTLVRTGQRNYGSAPLHCESSRLPPALCRVWALANEIPPGVPVPGSGHCHRRHRPAPAGSPADLGTGGETRPGVGEPLGPATRPRFDSHRWHWHPSPQRLTAWPARHRLNATPSRICRDPRGWEPSARPFFCWLFGAVEQHLIPVDPLPGVIALGQLAPRGPKSLQGQPALEPSLHRLVGRKAQRHHPPPNPRHQDLEYGVQTCPVVVGRTAVATPHYRWEQWRKERPHVLGHLPGKVSQWHDHTSWRQRSALSTIKSHGGFVP